MDNTPNPKNRPFGTVAHDGESSQQHNLYLDENNEISDIWYDGDGNWRYQCLNKIVDGVTPPLADSEPFGTVAYHGGSSQQHNFFLDTNSKISDIWYNGDGEWSYQCLHDIVSDDNPPLAASDPFATQAVDGGDAEQHNFYRDVNGKISDIWYDGDGNWRYQCLHDLVADQNPPLAQSEPFATAAVDGGDAQQHNLFMKNGRISDIWYDGDGNWNIQSLLQLVATSNPPAAISAPFGTVDPFGGDAQQHNLYKDVNGNISDLWYTGDDSWAYQCLQDNVSSHNPPKANGAPFGLVVPDSSAQQHNLYRDANGRINDIWYNGDGEWSFQCLNEIRPEAPKATGRPFGLVVHDSDAQQHNLYLDVNGKISDIWYDGDGNWNYQCLTDKVLTQWQSHIKGNQKVSQVTIPGTHESCAHLSGYNAQCQTLSLIDQLSKGIRFLDIRCKYHLGKFEIWHGKMPEFMSFGPDVRDVCIDFLKANPSEFILFSIKQEVTSSNEFEDTLKNYLKGYEDFFYTGTTIPTVDQARGKMVLISRYENSTIGINARPWPDNDPDFTIPGNPKVAPTFHIQDHYQFSEVNSNAVADKQKNIMHLLGEAMNPGNEDTLFLNFCSASADEVGAPTSFADSINPFLSKLMPGFQQNKGRYGTIIMDFPENEPDLIRQIVTLNPDYSAS